MPRAGPGPGRAAEGAGGAAALLAHVAANRGEAERLLCAASLRDFLRRGWPVVEPAAPYVHGRVVDAVCEHLEAVTAGGGRGPPVKTPAPSPPRRPPPPFLRAL